MKYNEHDSYQIGYQLANLIWKIVKKWDYFSQGTIGRQLVRAIDAISSNIAEGWHRYYKKDISCIRKSNIMVPGSYFLSCVNTSVYL